MALFRYSQMAVISVRRAVVQFQRRRLAVPD
jgi:hypothetical protein